MTERRQALRKRINIDARFQGADEAVLKGRVRNLSSSGAFVETDTPPEPGSLVSITLDALELGRMVAVTARVMRLQTHEGMGVEFLASDRVKVLDLLEAVRQRERQLLKSLSLLGRA